MRPGADARGARHAQRAAEEDDAAHRGAPVRLSSAARGVGGWGLGLRSWHRVRLGPGAVAPGLRRRVAGSTSRPHCVALPAPRPSRLMPPGHQPRSRPAHHPSLRHHGLGGRARQPLRGFLARRRNHRSRCWDPITGTPSLGPQPQGLVQQRAPGPRGPGALRQNSEWFSRSDRSLGLGALDRAAQDVLVVGVVLVDADERRGRVVLVVDRADARRTGCSGSPCPAPSSARQSA